MNEGRTTRTNWPQDKLRGNTIQIETQREITSTVPMETTKEPTRLELAQRKLEADNNASHLSQAHQRVP